MSRAVLSFLYFIENFLKKRYLFVYRYICMISFFAYKLASSFSLNNEVLGALSFVKSNRRSACEEIPRVLSNPKVNFRVHDSPPLAIILSEKNSVRSFTHFYLRSILRMYLHCA
jgi:hypothetical protein